MTFNNSSLSGSITGTAVLGTAAASIAVAGGGTFTVTFTSNSSSVSAANLVLNAAGATLTGSYTITYVNTPTPASTTFTASGAQIDYGNGLIGVSNLSGSVTVSAAGIASGSTVTGTVSTQIGQAQFGGTISADFTAASLVLTGTNDTLSVGDQSITGNFTFSLSAGMVSIAATGVKTLLGNGVVSVNNASGSVTITSTTAFSGTITTGTLTAGSTLAGNGVSFGASSLTVTVAPGAITAAGTGDTVVIGSSPTITGNFSFSEDSAGLELMINSVSINASAFMVSGAQGSVLVTPSGLSGSVSGAFTSTVAGLSGNLGVIFTTGPPASLQITASNTNFVIGTGASQQSITGDFAVTVTGSTVTLATTDLTASLGGGLVTVGPQPGAPTGASGSLTITSGTVSGTFSGYIAVGSATGVSFAGQVSLSVSNTNISASGTNDTITVGGQNVTASFTVSLSGGQLQLQNITVSSFSLGGVVTLNNLTGSLNIGSTGISGSLTVTAGFTSNIASLAGTFTLAFAPGVLAILGTGASLTVQGQTVSGTFSFTQTAGGTQLTATNFGANFGGGLVTIANGTGLLNISSAGAVSGSFTGTLGVSSLTSGVSGHAVFEGPISVTATGTTITASGTGDTLNLAGQTLNNVSFSFFLSGSTLSLTVAGLSLAIPGIVAVNNATGTLTVTSAGITGTASGALSSTLIGLSGGLAVSFAPGSLQISGTNDTLAVGDQSISGNFNFVTNAGTTTLTASNFSASLGGGLVTVSNASGTLTVSSSSVTGTITGTVAAGTAQSVAFSGPITVSITTGSSGSVSASGTGDTLTVAGQSITGNFAFSEDASTHVLSISINNVTAFSLGGAFNISNLSGSLTVATTGVSGSLSAMVTSNISGLSAGGMFMVIFSPGNVQVSVTGTTISIGGQSISGSFNFVQSSGSFTVTATDFSASLGGGLVTVTGGSGTLNITNNQVTGSFTGMVSAGSSETGASFAGPITVSVTPTSISAGTPAGQVDTLTIGGQQITAALSFSWNGTTLSVAASNLSFSLGGRISITNASGMLQISPAGVSGSATSGSVSANFSGFTFTGSLSVAFAPGTLSISGTNDVLTAGDETISGSFNFTQDATGIHLSSTNLAASLAGGLVTVSGGMANLSLANGQVTGSFSGMVAAGNGLTGVSFTGAVSVTLGPGTFAISTPAGQSDTLMVAGQQFSAGFSFSEDANGLELAVSNLSFSLPTGSANPVLSLMNAGGMLHVAATGVSGSVSGTIAATFPGVMLGGTLAITLRRALSRFRRQ